MPRNIEFGEMLYPLNKKTRYRSTNSTGINTENVKIVTLLDQSHSEKLRDITFCIKSGFGKYGPHIAKLWSIHCPTMVHTLASIHGEMYSWSTFIPKKSSNYK